MKIRQLMLLLIVVVLMSAPEVIAQRLAPDTANVEYANLNDISLKLDIYLPKYDLDHERIGAWRSSAGGHLVAMLGTAGNVDTLEGTVGGNLQYSSRLRLVWPLELANDM